MKTFFLIITFFLCTDFIYGQPQIKYDTISENREVIITNDSTDNLNFNNYEDQENKGPRQTYLRFPNFDLIIHDFKG